MSLASGVLDWEGLQCEPNKWGCWTGRGCSVSLASGVLDWEGLQCEPSKWGCWTGRGCSVSLG